MVITRELTFLGYVILVVMASFVGCLFGVVGRLQQQELRSALHRAEALGSIMTKFSTHLSHEIRYETGVWGGGEDERSGGWGEHVK